jgi:hypothetical protein
LKEITMNRLIALALLALVLSAGWLSRMRSTPTSEVKGHRPPSC